MKELSIIETSLISGGFDNEAAEFFAFLGMGTFLGAGFGASLMAGISLVTITNGPSIAVKTITYAIAGAVLGALPGAYLGIVLHGLKTHS